MTERLTDEERAYMNPGFRDSTTAKDLRIIDAHESDRAALVKERDEARAAYEEHARESHRRGFALKRAETEVAILTDALAAAERDLERDEERKTLAAREPESFEWIVAKALRIIDAHEAKERDEAREALKEESDIADFHAAAATRLEGEVARLNEALADKAHVLEQYAAMKDRAEVAEQKLAAAEQKIERNMACWLHGAHELEAAEQKLAAAELVRLETLDMRDRQRERADAAEARCRELESERDGARVIAGQADEYRAASESDLAQLRDRVAELQRISGMSIEEHVAAQKEAFGGPK